MEKLSIYALAVFMSHKKQIIYVLVIVQIEIALFCTGFNQCLTRPGQQKWRPRGQSSS